MRIVFVYYAVDDRGSSQDLKGYARAARELGHEIVVYSRRPGSFDSSLDLSRVDALVFIFEWTWRLRWGDGLDWARLLANVPRQRRIVIDCDGKYNEYITIQGDSNHDSPNSARCWREICESLTDTICQPTFHPRQTHIHPFLFHAYDPAWERPLEERTIEFDMLYIGHNWYRWQRIKRVLDLLAKIRSKVGRIGLVGHGWDRKAPWAQGDVATEAYRYDAGYLDELDVEVFPPVHFEQVIPWMSRAAFSPIVLRPTFEELEIVSCRTFETPAASTIPLFCQSARFVREIYGECGTELCLPDQEPEAKILDILERRTYYKEILYEIRAHLRHKHSYTARLKQLLTLIDNQ